MAKRNRSIIKDFSGTSFVFLVSRFVQNSSVDQALTENHLKKQAVKNPCLQLTCNERFAENGFDEGQPLACGTLTQFIRQFAIT